MKKILGLFIVIIFLTGCFNTKTEKVDYLDLEQVSINLNQTKFNEEFLFNGNLNLSKDYLTAYYGIDFTDIENFVVSIPYEADNTNMFAIFKANTKDAKKEVYDFFDKYKAELNAKGDTKQLNKMKTYEHGNYIICIGTPDNDAVFKTIKEG